MQCRFFAYLRVLSGACGLVCFPACDAILGLDEFSVVDPPSGDTSGLLCASHLECGELVSQYRCVPGQARCASLRSEDCEPVAGPDEDERAIWIGTLLSTSGVHASANVARQQSAILAVEQVNAAGGIRIDRESRPLVLVACDASRDWKRAANHLIGELGIRAIIGPDDSHNALELATQLTIPTDTFLISPVTSLSGLAELLDDDLNWQMVPDDERRAPWIMHHLRALEAATVKRPDQSELTLSIVVRDDVQGQSARASLASLTFGGKPLTDPLNLGSRVRIEAYAPDRSDLSGVVDNLLAHRPNLVVLLGMSEAITRVLTPLEERWAAANPDRRPPEYLLTDSAKVPELVELAARRDELRSRIRGIGVGPAPASESVQLAFASAYQQRFASELTAISGLDSTYDATLAVALGIASLRGVPTSGRALAAALRRAVGGERRFQLRRDQLANAFEELAAGRSLAPIGALAPLRWDDRGDPATGTVQVWCLQRAEGRTNFASSGFRASVLEPPRGEFGTCELQGVQTSPAPTNTARPTPDRTPNTETPPTPNETPDAAPSSMDGGVAPDAETDAGTGMPELPMSMPAVPCGASSCSVADDQYCCVSTVRGISEDPQPEDFQCRTTQESCALALHCSSDRDCGEGLVCCGTNTVTHCIAEAECASQAGTRLACESARDCAEGESCCAQLMPGIGGYSGIECAAGCVISDRALVLCETDLDCAEAYVLGDCRPSRIIPNLKVCGVL